MYTWNSGLKIRTLQSDRVGKHSEAIRSRKASDLPYDMTDLKPSSSWQGKRLLSNHGNSLSKHTSWWSGWDGFYRFMFWVSGLQLDHLGRTRRSLEQALRFQKSHIICSVPLPQSDAVGSWMFLLPCPYSATMDPNLKSHARSNAFFLKLPWSWGFITPIRK